jgi:hypothetical protein
MEQTLLTTRYRTYLADRLRKSLTVDTSGLYSYVSNTYIGIGRVPAWAVSDTNVETIPETTNTYNKIVDNLVSMKKLTGSDTCLVIPRVDWATGIVYTEYGHDVELFSHDAKTILTSNASALSGNNLLTANGTSFTTTLTNGDIILMYGDNIGSPIIKKEVVAVNSDTSVTVNSNFSSAYTSNSLYKVSNTYPKYASNFYVRNTKDQVFKCLYNNFGATSTVMPEISIDGNLPSNAYVTTIDGYKWKYLYTIPGLLKKKFFNLDWMPILDDSPVLSDSVFGGINIIEVMNGGINYNNRSPSSSVPIITVVGDGTGANIVATVNSTGVITNTFVNNAGSNYTYANIIVKDTPGSNGAGALLKAVIEPPTAYPIFIDGTIDPNNNYGGHGANLKYELGATNLMISVDLVDTETGLPTYSSESDQSFDYREISLIRNPLTISGTNISYANTSDLTCFSKVLVTQPPAGAFYSLDEIVYQAVGITNPTVDQATFQGTVVYWDIANRQLWLNNITGTFVPEQTIFGTINTVRVKAISLEEPAYKLYTGDILYVDNRTPITRAIGQTEQIKIVLQF